MVNSNMNSKRSWTRNTTFDAGPPANYSTTYNGWVMRVLMKNTNGPPLSTLCMQKNLSKNIIHTIPPNPVLTTLPLITTLESPAIKVLPSNEKHSGKGSNPFIVYFLTFC